MQKFLVKGVKDSKIRWFLLDLSEDNRVSRRVFEYVVQSHSANEYVLVDGRAISTGFHFNGKSLKDHTHKIILIVHPKLL